MTAKTAKAVGLFSGGLDSMLAALVLDRAGVAVELVTFQSPFFSAAEAARAAARLGFRHTVLEAGEPYLALLKNPPHGYGSNMNPCIDCHAFMIEKAGAYLEAKGLDFIFTGEVMGQRPMSQNKGALNLVAKQSGFRDKILRPLSAKVMPPTPMEESGLVDRERLEDITGRGRKRQLALAEEFGITEFPNPAGGCLLTDPGFSRRLKDLLEHNPEAGEDQMHILRHGRHFRLSPRAKMVIGRNQDDNRQMEENLPSGALRLILEGMPGPLGLYLGPDEPALLEKAASMVASYGKTAGGKARVRLGEDRIVEVTPMHRRHLQEMLL